MINYYSAKYLKYEIEGEGDEYFALIMDRVETLEENDIVRKVITYVYQDIIQYQKDYYKRITDLDFVNKELSTCLKHHTELIGDKAKKFRYYFWKIYPDIVGMTKELKRYHIPITDFHDDNIGWSYRRSIDDEPRLVLFDLGGYVSIEKY